MGKESFPGGAPKGQALELSPKQKLERKFNSLLLASRPLLDSCRLEFKTSGDSPIVEGTTEDGRQISVMYDVPEPEGGHKFTKAGKFKGTIDGKPLPSGQANDLFVKYNGVAAFQTLARSLREDPEARQYLGQIGVNL